jgi:hypothetical protein
MPVRILALKGKVKNKIDMLVKAVVEEPTDWVNSLVITEKENSDDIRISLD